MNAARLNGPPAEAPMSALKLRGGNDFPPGFVDALIEARRGGFEAMCAKCWRGVNGTRCDCTRAMAAVHPDDPLMIAWEIYRQTQEFDNTKRWAVEGEHVEGSLWAAFERGFRAAPPSERAAVGRGPFGYEVIDPDSEGRRHLRIFDRSDSRIATCYSEENARFIVRTLNRDVVGECAICWHERRQIASLCPEHEKEVAQQAEEVRVRLLAERANDGGVLDALKIRTEGAPRAAQARTPADHDAIVRTEQSEHYKLGQLLVALRCLRLDHGELPGVDWGLIGEWSDAYDWSAAAAAPTTMTPAEELIQDYREAAGLPKAPDGGGSLLDWITERARASVGPEHRCGVRGFDQIKGDVCPGCEATLGHEENQAIADRILHQDRPDGIARIAAERRRQVEREGWSAEHDEEQHGKGELAICASIYAMPEAKRPMHRREDRELPVGWPRDCCDWKPGDRIRELEKSGALCAAEIDRLLRARVAAGGES